MRHGRCGQPLLNGSVPSGAEKVALRDIQPLVEDGQPLALRRHCGN